MAAAAFLESPNNIADTSIDHDLHKLFKHLLTIILPVGKLSVTAFPAKKPWPRGL